MSQSEKQISDEVENEISNISNLVSEGNNITEKNVDEHVDQQTFHGDGDDDEEDDIELEEMVKLSRKIIM